MENIENILKKKTKVFFDCEFTGLHQGTTLISIGAISECGKTFYAEFTDYTITQVNGWIRENVIAKLQYGDEEKRKQSSVMFLIEGFNYTGFGNTETIKGFLEKWLAQFDEVEMWSDHISYDWVLFNQIWGHAFNIPKNVHYIPFDICTVFKMKGIDADISREDFVDAWEESQIDFKHNALWDAKVIKMCYEKLFGVV